MNDTVGCPVCFVRYVDEPFRCEACGYRFADISPFSEKTPSCE